MDNQELLIFKAINGFVSELHEQFGNKYKGIALYNRLLEKTGLVHVGPIRKHIQCFRQFFATNAATVTAKNTERWVDPKISYSSNVYIDMSVIFKQCTKEDQPILWQHLLTIWSLLDPLSGARQLLQQYTSSAASATSSETPGKEQDFLASIMNKVQETAEKSNLKDTTNPMEAISSLMQSGAMNDLVGGMYKGLSDGSLDVGRLMGSVQSMVGGMAGAGAGGGGAGMGGMGGMPDISSMMSMMGPMMAQMMGGAGGGLGGGLGNMGLPQLPSSSTSETTPEEKQ